MPAHIHIVTAPNDPQMESYLVMQLAAFWREAGHAVTVGPCRELTADVGILHVDRTWVPAECVPTNPRGRPLLNGAALDISKRRISRNLLTPDSAWTGPAIIKTNANYYGWREGPSPSSPRLERVRRLLQRHLSWRLMRQLPPQDYPVVRGLADVPDWVWPRDDLVVERFLPEIAGDEYALRVWLFFGDREYGARLFSRHPLVKVRTMTRYEYIDTVPDTLRNARRQLKMDFGKFDYVMVDGEAVLLDANKTPTVSASGSRTGNLPRLAGGLGPFLERGT